MPFFWGSDLALEDDGEEKDALYRLTEMKPEEVSQVPKAANRWQYLVVKMTGPFKRWGGSSRYAKQIIKTFPEHGTYVEAFCGGASVFMNKEAADNEVINDLDPELIHAMRMIQQIDDETIEKLESFDRKISRDTFLKLKNDGIPDDSIERLHRFLYLSGASWGGIRRGLDTGHEKLGKDAYNPQRLLKYKDRLAGVIIENMDYKEVIDKYDGKDTFFFLDPPWPGEWTKDTTDIPDESPLDMDEFVEKVNSIEGNWIVELGDDEESRASLDKLDGYQFMITLRESTGQVHRGDSAFKESNRYFASSFDVEDNETVESVKGLSTPFSDVSEDERIVTGVVMVPDVVDAQGDVITKEAIRNAVYLFSQKMKTGVMHKDYEKNIKILESYQAPGDLEIGGHLVPDGSWVVTCKVLDDETWEKIRLKKLRGFSVKGTAWGQVLRSDENEETTKDPRS